MHTLDWLFFLGYFPFLELRLVLLLSATWNSRVAVADADGDDAGEQVEVAAAAVVPQVLHVAAVDQQRVGVEERRPRGQLRPPRRQGALVLQPLQTEQTGQYTMLRVPWENENAWGHFVAPYFTQRFM